MIAFLKGSKKKDISRRTVVYCLTAVTERYDILPASIALANYFASAKGYRTALTVPEDDRTVLRMLSEMECVDTDPVGYADAYLTYYVTGGPTDIRKLKARSYERIVMAEDESRVDGQLLSETDHLRLFADISPWRYHDIRTNNRFLISDSFEGVQRSGKIVYTASARKSDRERLKREFGAEVVEVGCFKDPYRLEKSDLAQVERYL